MSDPSMIQHSPAAERNRAPILEALLELLPPAGRMLEIAAGSGQHALHFAAAVPGWTWLPTDPDDAALASIRARRAQQPLVNLLPPQRLDVLTETWSDPWADEWPVTPPFDAIYCANMLHIAPWACCAALMRGAVRLLSAGGLLLVYGPFLDRTRPTAAGNAAFDADLRSRDPGWGIRWLHEVDADAQACGLALRLDRPMPANNRLLVFGRRP